MRFSSVNMAERRSRRQAARWGMVAAWASVCASACGDEPPWEIAPYRIHMTLAVDDTVRPEPGLQARLSQQLQQRVEASLRPWWVLTIEGAADPAARRMCFAPDLTTTDEPPLPLPPVDKMMWVGVSAAPVGYEIQVQEFDALTRRWAWPVHSTARQRSMLAESTFRAVVEAFAPLARIEPGETPADAQLIMKGGALPRPPGADLLTAPGDAFLPMVRRVRGGSSDSSLPVVPWTYLVAVDESPGIWRAVVDSALRQPLAARRRGLVEHLAIGLGRPREPAMVRFFARSNPDEPLAGYEVFRIPAEGENPVLAGRTGADGVFAVYPGEQATTTLLLRSDGQVLAKLVVASGGSRVIEAPIADDRIRLAAQAEVQALREELIDVVARRTLMVAQVRKWLKEKDIDEARRTMAMLNELPTPTAFSNRLDSVAKSLPVSDDPRVRQTVEGLLTSTRELLSRFLDARTITSLQAEVNAASRAASDDLASGQ